MYYIIGADQNQYGPVSADQVRQWISEGRLNGQSQVRAEGQDWRPLATFSEFAEALAAKFGAPPVPSAVHLAAATATAGPGVEDLLARDYSLDIGACVSAGWRLLFANFGTIFGGLAVFMVVRVALALLNQIPLLNMIFVAVSLVLTGPLTGGLWYFLLRNIRRQPVDVGDVFAGFKISFAQLVIGCLVLLLGTILVAAPGLLLALMPILRIFHRESLQAGDVRLVSVGMLLVLVPVTYVNVIWNFTLPLIIDRRMHFWEAMNLSRRMVSKHWWAVFGLQLVCGLVNLAGVLACCVGLVVSAPVSLLAMMYGYETIFSGRAPEAS